MDHVLMNVFWTNDAANYANDQTEHALLQRAVLHQECMVLIQPKVLIPMLVTDVQKYNNKALLKLSLYCLLKLNTMH